MQLMWSACYVYILWRDKTSWIPQRYQLFDILPWRFPHMHIEAKCPSTSQVPQLNAPTPDSFVDTAEVHERLYASLHWWGWLWCRVIQNGFKKKYYSWCTTVSAVEKKSNCLFGFCSKTVYLPLIYYQLLYPNNHLGTEQWYSWTIKLCSVGMCKAH